MSKITQLNERSIVVEVPEGTKNYHVWAGDKPQLGYEYITKNLIEKEFGDSTKYISLPPGSYSILGRPEEITEVQWRGIVERDNRKTSNGLIEMEVSGFKDYERFGGSSLFQVKSTATESGLSLLKSKGLQDKSIIILIKQ